MPVVAYPVQRSSRNLTITAWATTLLVSALPNILWNELTGGIPDWLVTLKMGFLLGMGLAAWFWSPLRPLRNFFVILFAVFGLAQLGARIDFSIPALQGAFWQQCF